MRLRCSPLGPDFPRERFLSIPIGAIFQALEYVDNDESRRLNLASASTAKLCMQVLAVAHGMAGSKTPIKQKLTDFLPFPDWQPLGTQQRLTGPSPETRATLGRLLRERRLPISVYTQLVSTDEASLD